MRGATVVNLQHLDPETGYPGYLARYPGYPGVHTGCRVHRVPGTRVPGGAPRKTPTTRTTLRVSLRVS
eukprot:3526672-Rhodomonas_salina.3